MQPCYFNFLTFGFELFCWTVVCRVHTGELHLISELQSKPIVLETPYEAVYVMLMLKSKAC